MHDYDYVSDPGKIGMHAAAGIGIDPEKVFKTLMVEIDKKQVVCTAIPANLKMDLKKVAALMGGRNARMLGAEKAEALTGFQLVGSAPLGRAPPCLLFLTKAYWVWTSSTSMAAAEALLWNWLQKTP